MMMMIHQQLMDIVLARNVAIQYSSSNSTTAAITKMNTILYSIGTLVCIMTVGDASFNDDDNNHRTIETALTECLQYVQHVLTSPTNGETTLDAHRFNILHHLQISMIPQLQQSYDIYQQERTDQSIDQQIIQAQYQKQESARTIAQRLASSNNTTQSTSPIIMDTTTTTTTNATVSATTAQLINTTVPVVDDMDIPIPDHPNDNKNTIEKRAKRKKKSSSSDQTRNTTIPSWDEIQTEWYTVVKPIQLSLDLLLHWVSLSSSSCGTNHDPNDEEKEISIPLPLLSSRMDVDDASDQDDDEYNATTMSMNMDHNDDDDDSHLNANVHILHGVLCTNTIFRTVLEFYQFVLPWYKSITTTTTTNVSPPMRMIRETVSDLLCKIISVVGQLFLTQDDSRLMSTGKYNNLTLDDVTLELWNDLKGILGSDATTPTKSITEPQHATEEEMMTIPIEDVSMIDTIKTIQASSNASTGNDLSENHDTQIHESITSTMVAILRRGPRFGTTTSSSLLNDVIDLLHHHSDRVAPRDREPIVIRDIICMTGMILSDSSSTLSDQDVATATRALLQSSMAFMESKSQQSSSSPPSGNNMIVSVSDVDDDTSLNDNATNAPTSTLTISLTQNRKARLMVGMETLNVLMDVYSDDDKVGSMKYNLYYQNHPSNPNVLSSTAIIMSVSKYYEQMIPIFKQDLFVYQHTAQKEDDNDDSNDTTEHMLEVWHEILDNSIRFVQYKKEHQ